MNQTQTPPFANGPVCPVPFSDYPTILLAHGGGGKLTQQLLEKLFLPAFQNTALEARHDGALLDMPSTRLAFSTDSYVVKPLFFPGGDIGTLAINGTVNDLAMCGATPLYLSAGFILEEGLPTETLWRVIQSMASAARQCGVKLVTGDTKVVDRGKADGIFINTAGIGVREYPQIMSPNRVRPGDAVILSGDIGRHGIAIMALREGLAFETSIESDCAPVAKEALALLRAGLDVHCMRDLTRGGLASATVEIATEARALIQLDEDAIPVREDVRGACEILGFDPLYVANEGRFIAFTAPSDASAAVEILRRGGYEQACIIGTTAAHTSGMVTAKNQMGTTRVVDMLSGEQLPRIC